jgi:hypothetical protein
LREIESCYQVADNLSHLDIDSLNIQEAAQEALTLLSGSENNSVSNIKFTLSIHAVLIFNKQAKVKGKLSFVNCDPIKFLMHTVLIFKKKQNSRN